MSQMILDRVRLGYDNMSPTNRRLAEFIAQNYAEVAFMSAAQLAHECDTHESAVVKFAVSLGYAGYPDMLREIQTAAKGFMEPSAREEDDSNPRFASYRSMLLSGSEFLKTSTMDSGEAFSAMVNAVLAAKKVYVVGFYAEAPLAEQATFQFDLVGKRITSITDSGLRLHEDLRLVGPADLVLCFSFPPYLAGINRALTIAAERKAASVVMTDRPSAPVASKADIVVAIDPTGGAHPVERRILATSLVSAMATAYSLLDRENALASMEQLEELLAEYQIHMPQT